MAAPIYNIVGLGNPEPEYEGTRHNTGKFFATLFQKRYKGLKAKVILPETYMNESGKAVKGLAAKKLVVLHDDIDLPLGKFKIVFNRGSGGHKGVESVIRALGTEKFIRIRIGISPKKKPNHKELLKFLTSKFKPSEAAALKRLSKKILSALETIVTEGHEKAMSLYNQ
ncbi:MAG: aminoacyl-tRNA hydrolase [Patescibacteria group bacterium]